MSIIMVESTRQIQHTTSKEQRYYISSRPANATFFAKAIRQHWGIENQLHWVLDVTFDEDQCRVRTGNAAENFSLIRKMAFNPK